MVTFTALSRDEDESVKTWGYSRSKRAQRGGRKVLVQVIWTNNNEGGSLITVGSRYGLTLTRSSIWAWTMTCFLSWTRSAHHDISVRRNTHLSIHHDFWRHGKQQPAGGWHALTRTLTSRRKSIGLNVRTVCLGWTKLFFLFSFFMPDMASYWKV